MDPISQLLQYLMGSNPMHWNLSVLQQLIGNAHGTHTGAQTPWAGWQASMGNPRAMGGLDRGLGMPATLPDPSSQGRAAGTFSGEAPGTTTAV